MAKLLKKTFGLGSKKAPPQPPKPDYRGQAARRVSEGDNSDEENSVGSSQTTTSTRQRERVSRDEDAATVTSGGSRHRKSRTRASRGGPSVGPRSTSMNASSTSSIARLRNDGPILLQDYSEPFDANRSNLPVSPRSKTDDYTEPYDATKLKKPVPRARPSKTGRRSEEAEAMSVEPDPDGQLYDDPLNMDPDDLADNSMESLGDGEGDYPAEEYDDSWELSFKNSLAHWQGLDDPDSPLSESPPGASGGMSPDVRENHDDDKPSLPRSASATYPAKVEIEIGKYVDPDRSQNGSRANLSDTNGEECLGNYEEPWDLQAKTLEIENKIRAAKKRLSKPELGDGCEFSDNGLKEQDKQKLHHQMSLDGRTHPLNDEPGLDYDEPWDLKKKNVISQLTSAVSTYRAQEGPATLQHQLSCSSTGSLPIAKPRTPKNSPPTNTCQKKKAFNMDLERALAAGPPKDRRERVEPALPLDKQGWYHGNIGRVEAEGLLRTQKEGSFLVRNSESSKQDYSLSLKSSRGFMHMKIVFKDNAYILGQFSQPYKSIPDMIHHYSIHKLPIKGAEHMSLVHPVCQDLL